MAHPFGVMPLPFEVFQRAVIPYTAFGARVKVEFAGKGIAKVQENTMSKESLSPTESLGFTKYFIVFGVLS